MVSTPRGGLSLKRNFSWTLGGNVLAAAGQWGQMLVLARCCEPEQVGEFALGLAIASPLLMFSNLNLRSVQITDVRGRYRFGDYLGLRLFTTAVALFVLALLTALVGYNASAGMIALGLGLTKGLEAVSDIMHGFQQQHDRMDLVSRSVALRSLLGLSALAVVTGATGLVWTGVLALAGVSLGVLLLYDVPNVRARLSERWLYAGAQTCLPPEQRELARIALPLGLVMLLLSLQTSAPRFFLERHVDIAAVGIFAALVYISTAANVLVDALGQSITPRLARHADAGSPEFRRVLVGLLAAGALLGVAGLVLALLAGKQLLGIVYGAPYAASAPIFVILMAATGVTFVGSFLGFGMTAARLFRSQVHVSAVSLLAVVVVCAWLVPQRGMQGAAWAVFAGAAVRVVACGSILAVSPRTGHSSAPSQLVTEGV